MHKNHATRAVLALFAGGWVAAALTLPGCGAKGPATAPVVGVVRQANQPVEGAMVLFARGSRDLAKGELAMGKTDAQGRFTLTTHLGGQNEAQGAPPGNYEVTISKRVPPPGMSESQYRAIVEAANKIGETGAMAPPDKQPPPTVEKFPPKYSAMGQSELKAEVTLQGPNDFTFNLD